MAKYKKDKQGRYYLDKIIGGQRCMIRGKTEKEVDRKLKDWLTSKEEKEAEAAQGPYFEDVAKDWWEKLQCRAKYGTIRSYKARYASAVEWFQGCRINAIGSREINLFFADMAKKGYSHKTISNEKILLSSVFAWHDPESTVVANSKIPKQAKPSVIRQPPSADQTETIKQHPEGFGFTAHFIMYTGLRLGEANGVQVKDIDFDKMCYGIKGCISVNKAFPWKGGKPYQETLKTDAGNRIVPIFAPLQQLLKQRCEALSENDFILSGRETPLTKSEYEREWDHYCYSLGLAHKVQRSFRRNGELKHYDYWKADITAHQFRHELATCCFEAGVPEMVAQKILGHASIETTHRIYTHIRERMLTQSALALNDLFTQNLRTHEIKDDNMIFYSGKVTRAV